MSPLHELPQSILRHRDVATLGIYGHSMSEDRLAVQHDAEVKCSELNAPVARSVICPRISIQKGRTYTTSAALSPPRGRPALLAEPK